jgi:hypothetical protein
VKPVLVVFLLVTLAWAVRAYAPCPIDKEDAAYEGLHNTDKSDPNYGKCKFRHVYVPRGGGDGEVHEFWASCED